MNYFSEFLVLQDALMAPQFFVRLHLNSQKSQTVCPVLIIQ